MKTPSTQKKSTSKKLETEIEQKLNEITEKNQQQLQNIFNNAPAATAVLDGPEHKFILANKAYLKLFNRQAKDLLGKSIHVVFPELEDTGAIDLIDHVFETGESFTTPEYALLVDVNKDSVLRQNFYHFSMEPLKNDSGKIYAVIAMFHDITEQIELRKKVEASERRHHMMLMQSPFAFAVLKGKDMVVAMANDSIKQMWGKGNQIEGKPLLEVLPELKDQQFPILLNKVYTTGNPYISNESHARVERNGKMEDVYFNFVYQPYHETDDIISGVTIIAVEITEQVEAKKIIEESEEKYRMLFSSIDEAVSTIDVIFDGNQKAVDFLFIENNSAFTKLTGLPENVIGKRWLEFVPAIDPYVADIFERVIRTGESVRAENYVESLDKWHNTFFTLSGGVGSNRIICVYSDITERKQTEKKIKESENRFRDIADASPVLIWTIDANGLPAFYNKTFLDFIGASKDENISDWRKIVHPDDVQSTFKTINTAIAERHSYSLECRLLRADGQWRWVMAQGNPRMGNNNEFLGFVGSSVDITERKQHENEIMQAKTSAENAAKSKQKFLSTMSHEIRTPLNSILGFANVLLKTELGVEQKEFVQAIKTSGKSLNLLINDILDLAKVDAGKMTFVTQPFEIRKSIASILHSFVMKIKEKNFELIEEYDNNIPPILLGDSLRLNQILFNLISNAVKFTPKGKIKFSVELLSETEENAMLKFVVSDSGIGISNNKLNSIFNVFEQAEHSTYTSYGGTGLGLAIVKQLVETQGGSLSVKSKLGEGSTFGFIMSFGKTNIKLEAEIEILKPDPEIKNLRVLVAEDVPLNQVLIKIILNDFKFEQEIVSNGKLAIEKMQTNTYDIILMDLQMPEMNGFEATEYIRTTMKSQIPIIALTADVTTVDISKCQEFGMDDYISKPINENLLYSKIVELVKRSK